MRLLSLAALAILIALALAYRPGGLRISLALRIARGTLFVDGGLGTCASLARSVRMCMRGAFVGAIRGIAPSLRWGRGRRGGVRRSMRLGVRT